MITAGIHIISLSAQSAIWLTSNISPNPPPNKSSGDIKPKESSFLYARIWLTLSKLINIPLAGFLAYKLYQLPFNAKIKYSTACAVCSVFSLIGGAIRLYTFNKLGKMFTFEIGIKNGAKLVKDGLYSVIRHPSYLGALFSNTGFCLYLVYLVEALFEDGVLGKNGRVLRDVFVCAVLSGPVFSAPWFYFRIREEEKMLVGYYGKEYQEYMKRTWRVLPGIY